MDVPLWFWIAFNVAIISILALDLGIFHRSAHVVSFKEAGIWSAIWVTLALLFNVGIYFYAGSERALEFLTGYLVEYSLAVDNIFVFLLIFEAFAVPLVYRHRVLFWGILGALIMRGTFILLGAYLIERFHWILYFFGAFLVITAVRMFLEGEEQEVDVEENVAVRVVRRFFPITKEYRGESFTVREAGKLFATPLLVVLAVIEVSDLIFAVDSIPAIFSITQDPFLVYTSNVFAILGLRSMYFLLDGVIQRFYYLRPALSVILGFIGVKMLLMDIYHVPIAVSLGVIVLVLVTAIVASILFPKADAQQEQVQEHS